MSQNQDNFMDKRTLIGIVLIGVIFFGWQSYLAKKYPKTNLTTPENQQAVNPASPEASTGTVNSTANTPATLAAAKPLALKEEKTDLIYKSFNFQISNLGFGIKNLELNDFQDRGNKNIQLTHSDESVLFQIHHLGDSNPLPFKIEKVSDIEFKGTAFVGATQITQTIQVNSEDTQISTKISATNMTPEFKGVTVVFKNKRKHLDAPTWYSTPEDHEEIYYKNTKIDHRLILEKDKSYEGQEQQVQLMAQNSQYFTAFLLDQSPLLPNMTYKVDMDFVTQKLDYPASVTQGDLEVAFKSYLGPKDINRIKDAFKGDLRDKGDKQLVEKIVDLGFFAPISKILLDLLRFFHTYLSNWGVAIIFLTLVVRFVVLPFHMASYKSMKKMQDIQPAIKTLRERYKDEPQKLNTEMMALMKTQKVNPIGGCLPMLLQMPVFFALFQVLKSSPDLYKAPFFGWIHDLSLKDPYYVLPILMAVAMWFQQKITPSTMEPAQARIMQFMPLIFALMMIGLPSGLTLYITVSTLFGIIQQQMFMKQKTAVVTAN